jgi:hypothetical protein
MTKHTFCLEPLSYGSGMEPDQRAVLVSIPSSPVQQAFSRIAAGASSGADLGVEQAQGWSQGRSQPDRGLVAPGCGGHGGNVAGTRDKRKSLAPDRGTVLKSFQQSLFHLQPRR